jgi:hypothetical protein
MFIDNRIYFTYHFLQEVAMKRHLLILSVLVLSLFLSTAVFAALKGNKMQLKVGDEVYACPCGVGCKCDTLSKATGGKCSCGNDMVKAKVIKVEPGVATLMADGWSEARLFKTEGKYICACGKDCKCDTISQNPGKCTCGADLKEYRK